MNRGGGGVALREVEGEKGGGGEMKGEERRGRRKSRR